MACDITGDAMAISAVILSLYSLEMKMHRKYLNYLNSICNSSVELIYVLFVPYTC